MLGIPCYTARKNRDFLCNGSVVISPLDCYACRLNLKNFESSLSESDFCRGPQRPSQDVTEPETNFSGKFFKLVDKTQFEAFLQTKAAEIGCTALEKTSLIRTEILL